MKIAILQCDDVLEKFQPEFGSYNGMIQNMINNMEGSFQFESLDCKQGQYPEDVDTFDFYITKGSKASVYEDEPWIQQLVDFVQKLDRQQKKLVGICFGHQVIARAKKQKVQKSTKGWGIGVAVNRIVNTPDWVTGQKHELNIIVSHQDQVMTLPDEAMVIAESDFCSHFVVQWNNHFLSIQGHPEWNTNYSRTLMNDRRAIIPAERIEAGLSSLTIQPDNKLFTQWILNFASSIK
ncbi:MAG: GMP synthase [Gammaproteobacteria bacterium]|nr:GMP synthase [Gammaproteobacteria bacterium]